MNPVTNHLKKVTLDNIEGFVLITLNNEGVYSLYTCDKDKTLDEVHKLIDNHLLKTHFTMPKSD